MKSKISRVFTLFLALCMILTVAPVSSFAAPAKAPLFEISDEYIKQGEEFEISIKFARGISKLIDPVAALDVCLEYNKDVYTFVSMEIGKGLQKAFDKITSNETTLDKGDYIYSAGTDTPGIVKWSLLTLDSFVFVKGEEFMKVRFKAVDLTSPDKNYNFKIKVTNAAAPDTLANMTYYFTQYTNNMELEPIVVTFSEWNYIENMNGFRLEKYNGKNVKSIRIPDTYYDPALNSKEAPVVSVASSAFRDNDEIREIIIGRGIKEIGAAAFMACSKLEHVVVYSPDVEIGMFAFFGTPSSLVIKCAKGSTADKYAQANNIKVEYFEDVNDCTYEGIDEIFYYNGNPVEFSDLKVYNSENELMTPGTDYSVSYKNNIKIGKAQLIVEGFGEYGGFKTIDFDILCPYHTSGSKYYTEKAVYDNCNDGGKVVKNCTFCKYHDESTILPAKEHDNCSWVDIEDSTCAVEGVKHLICSDCNKIVEVGVINKKPHNDSGEWIRLKDPTCAEEGLDVVYCADCKQIAKEKSVSKWGHSYETKILKEPTCQESGLQADVCSICSDEINVIELDIVECDMQWVVITEPKCGVEGEQSYQCRFCHKQHESIENKPVEALKCEAGDWVVLAEGSCTEDGEKVKYCINCGEVLERVITTHEGHKPENDWTIVTELTCVQDGYKIKSCTVCEEVVDYIKVTAQGHKEGNVVTTPATCTVDGSVKHYCSNCSQVYKEEVIKAQGHTDGEWRKIDATCKKEGSNNLHCSVCDEVIKSTVIKKLKHTEGAWTTISLPDCDTDGLKHKPCTVCGESIEKEILPAKGHLPVFSVEKLPTYNKEGREKVTCGVCGDLITYIPTRKVKPDIDKSGTVNSMDALLILQHITGLKLINEETLRNADLDGSGSINSTDALLVLQLSTGMITA